MNWLDYSILAIYFLGLLLMGFLLRHQVSKEDYYLGGRKIGWKPLTLSVMATQLSAVSFISAPAFVGLREGGGLVWLTYELAVPLAMLFLLWRLMPTLHASGVVSVYDYLERRFSMSTRLVISAVFQISRSFATGIMIYAISIILQGTIGLDFWQSIALIGFVTILYSLQGGMSAVVYGDALQMILIIIGAVLCLLYGLEYAGGISSVISQVDIDRLTALNTESTGFDGGSFGLLPMIFGGIVLYASYYGCDQSEAQRCLSAHDQKDLKKMLMSAAFLRFPITLLYCATGLVIGVFAFATPEFMLQIPKDSPDWMMPVFIINYLPNGIIGILLVAIMAAAMSSLSSAVNSLSAVTLEDICRITKKSLTDRQYLIGARCTGLFWGLITLIFSAFAGDIAPTVIEAINKIGSLFYGPILACFILGIYAKSVRSLHVNLGIFSGVLTNMMLWLFFENVFWFWWNLFGLTVTLLISLALSVLSNHVLGNNNDQIQVYTVSVKTQLSKINVFAMLIWFAIIASVCVLITYNATN
ncbi:sodium:solute symporter family transporter [Glaciecola sp. 1036]|uniref:sodium:solute symporter family transporter n=1 Tax=Alteromonadaceae TaxID=72275 RepID=UPI003CFE906B